MDSPRRLALAVSPAALVVALVAASLVVAPHARAGVQPDPVGGEVTLGRMAGLKYVRETLPVGSSGRYATSYEGAQVACGAHGSAWRVAAGGVAVGGDAAHNFVTTSRPADLSATYESPDDLIPDDFWDVTVKSVPGRLLTGFAVCAQDPALKYATTTQPNGTSSGRHGTASCPTGTSASAGGAFIATTGSFLNGSVPVNGAWSSRVLDTAGGAGGMQTYAVCRARGHWQVVNAPSVRVPAGQARTVVARCPAGSHVIGGGGTWGGAIATAHLAGTFPWDGPDGDHVPDDGWAVRGSNDAASSQLLRASATCLTP